MMKTLIASVAILGMLSATALTSKPANAGSGGAAIAGGVIGFAAGAIVGSQLSKNRGYRGSGRRGGGYRVGSGLALQRDLATLGFDPGPLDGRPGRQTNAALIAYQQTYGEIPDARLDANERRRLSARAMMVSMPVTYGDRNYWRHVQASLYLNGLDAGSFDGKPGRKTRNAIQQYQFRNNYAPTGELTPDQSQALLLAAHNSLNITPNPQQNWAAQPGQVQPGQVQPGFGQPGQTQQSPTVVTLPSTTVEPTYEQTTIDATQSADAPEPVFNLGGESGGAGQMKDASGDVAAVPTDEVVKPEPVEPAVTASQSSDAPAAEAQPKIHVDADGKPYIMLQGVKFYLQAAPATPETPAGNDNKVDVLTAQSAE